MWEKHLLLMMTLPWPVGRSAVTVCGSGAASTSACTDSLTTRFRLPGPNWRGRSPTWLGSRYGPQVHPWLTWTMTGDESTLTLGQIITPSQTSRGITIYNYRWLKLASWNTTCTWFTFMVSSYKTCGPICEKLWFVGRKDEHGTQKWLFK